MLDLVHKILYTGIGFAALTEEKAKEISAELVKRGEVTAEEGRKLAQDLLDRAQRQTEQFRKNVEDEVNRILRSTPVCSRQELDQLRARIERLEQCCPPPAAPSAPEEPSP